jgi:hypothetical protein
LEALKLALEALKLAAETLKLALEALKLAAEALKLAAEAPGRFRRCCSWRARALSARGGGPGRA